MLAIPFMEIPAPRTEAAVGLDPDSFRAFYDEALPHVYGYFLHRCGGSTVVAEDLTQETFLAVLRESSRRRTIGFTEELLDKIQKDDPATFSCQYINEPLVAGQQRAVSSRHS